MHPIGNFAADDRSPELQVRNLSTISSADRIFIHHVLLQGKDRHLLGRAMVRHTVPPCFYYIHFSSICQEKYIQFFIFFAVREFVTDCVARNRLIIMLIFLNKRETCETGYTSLDKP